MEAGVMIPSFSEAPDDHASVDIRKYGTMAGTSHPTLARV
jgi:hypothetical protein